MKRIFFIFILLLSTVFIFAQTAEKLEEILNTGALTYEKAVWFVMEAADVWDYSDLPQASASVDPSTAFRVAMEQKWLPRNVQPASPARMDGISLLLMRSFGLKGGLLYSLFKNPHYAYRELVYQDIIRGRSDPSMTVSGDDLVYIVGRILSGFDEQNRISPHSIKPAGMYTENR